MGVGGLELPLHPLDPPIIREEESFDGHQLIFKDWECKRGAQIWLGWLQELGDIGHWFGLLLELCFNHSYPKSAFGSKFWSVLEMLLQNYK